MLSKQKTVLGSLSVRGRFLLKNCSGTSFDFLLHSLACEREECRIDLIRVGQVKVGVAEVAFSLDLYP